MQSVTGMMTCRNVPCAERIIPALKEACGGELPAWLAVKGKVIVPDLNPDNVGCFAEEGARILCHHSITGKRLLNFLPKFFSEELDCKRGQFEA